jgi:hypothetical protein
MEYARGPEVSRRQLLQKRLRLLQIARVEPFREPAVNRSEQFARLLHLALVAPEACEAHGGAEFPGFGVLLARHRECAVEIGAFAASGLGDLRAMSPAMRLTSASYHFSLVISAAIIAPPMQRQVFEFAKFRIRRSQ